MNLPSLEDEMNEEGSDREMGLHWQQDVRK